MHKSGLRLSRWHRVVRAAQPLQDNEDEQSNGTLSKGDQGIQRFKRHDGAHPEDEAEPSEMQGGDDVQEDAPDSAPVLSVLDAKGGPGAEEKLHLAPMGAQGAEGQSVTLASYVTPLSPLNTGPPQNIAPAPSVSAVGAQTANKTHSHSPVEMDDVVWPIAVGIMFAVLVLVSSEPVSRASLCPWAILTHFVYPHPGLHSFNVTLSHSRVGLKSCAPPSTSSDVSDMVSFLHFTASHPASTTEAGSSVLLRLRYRSTKLPTRPRFNEWGNFDPEPEAFTTASCFLLYL